MKKSILFFALSILCVTANALVYNGKTLVENNNFIRTEVADFPNKPLQEYSGIGCSRTTSGYFWLEGDEDNTQICALDSTGKVALSVKIKGIGAREDWEDLSMATIDGVNYILIGAFGDNDLVYQNNYYIYYFVEPEIGTQTSISVTAKTIRFGYPDRAHNAETMMYDPIDKSIYIVDKYILDKNETTARMVFSLPFDPTKTYSDVQTLTKVCTLGKDGEKFIYLTAGDISADGKRILIKNKEYVLLWEREGNENLSVTLARQPQLVVAYKKEIQGEAIAWNANATVFYTTSDDKGAVPFFKYVDKVAVKSAIGENKNAPAVHITNGVLAIDGVQKVSLYNLCGQCVVANALLPVDVNHLKGIFILHADGMRTKVQIQ